MGRLALALGLLAWAAAAVGGENETRLPRSVLPLRYDLQITTSVCEDDPSFAFYGRVNIQVDVKEPTSIIKLHAKELNISFADTTLTAFNEHNQRIAVVSQDLDETHELLILQFSMTLCVDCLYILHLQFSGTLSTRLSGFYRSQYTDRKTGQTKWLGVTQFQATEARRAFPCFDEPQFKAEFKISLGRPIMCKALSNMPLVSTQKIPRHPNWVMDEFELTKRMSTYLLAWVISEFNCVESPSDKRIRVCGREDALDKVQLALRIGPLSLQYFEQYFDVNYPLSKSDMVGIPDFNAGAMENWGLITFRETYILYDEGSSTMNDKYKVTSIISHELAHQWFGNLVTLNWWSDLWLNEGFATFVAAMGVDNAFPQWNSKHTEAVNELISVYSLDGLVASHPISINISHPKEISQIFDVICYKKGSLVLRMANLFLGEEVFRQGVIKYLKKYQYSNADKDDLYNELTQESRTVNVLDKDLTMKDIMHAWTVETGYPVVTVYRNEASIILKQKRFLFYRGTYTGESPCWYIPITYTTQEEKDFATTKPKAWMRCNESELIIPNVANKDQWYILNIQSSGIYRVNYDTENWNMLSKTLNSRHYKNIGVMNRAQIVHDVLDFAWTSDVSVELAFRTVSYLRRETEYLPWKMAFHVFYNLANVFKRTPNYDLLMHWIRRLLKPSYERIGNPGPDDFHGTLHHEQLFKWACEMQLDACVYQTRVLFAQWMRTRDPKRNDIIPINLRSISICMAVKYGGEQEWDFAWKYYLSCENVNVKAEVLRSLGCSGQSWILRRYLQWILDEEGIRKQESSHIFLSVVQNEVGYTVAKDFFKTKIRELYALLGPRNSYFGTWLRGMASMMFTDEEYNEFTAFTDINKKYLEGSEMAINQAKEMIKNNIHWYKRNYPQYVLVLKNYKNSRRPKSS